MSTYPEYNNAPGLQTVSLPTTEDLARLEEQRGVIARMIGDEDWRAEFEKPSGKIAFLDAIMAQGAIKPHDTYGLQSMGAVLGDVFVETLGFEWVTVEDSGGQESALRFPGTTILLHPLTMISRRVERGEQVDVSALYSSVSAEVEKLRAMGY